MAFERVCGLSEVPENGALRVELADVDVAVVRYDGDVYAIQDVCSHAEVPLSEGDVEELDGAPTTECWPHGPRLDPRTGAPAGAPRSAWRGARSRGSTARPPSSAGCTGRASTCAPASPPACRPPSRSTSTRSAWRGRTCSSTRRATPRPA